MRQRDQVGGQEGLCRLVRGVSGVAIGNRFTPQLSLFYREAPINGIWEGSGNVICLDVLRTLQKEPLSAEMLGLEMDAAQGASRWYDGALHAYDAAWPGAPAEGEARAFVEHTALMLAAAA
ncbi:hypothetical protein FMN50_18270 [Rhodobacterales bacterium]|nr:hypothetical protein FMN50_18270 [Rhodobacterales bacterium]